MENSFIYFSHINRKAIIFININYIYNNFASHNKESKQALTAIFFFGMQYMKLELDVNN